MNRSNKLLSLFSLKRKVLANRPIFTFCSNKSSEQQQQQQQQQQQYKEQEQEQEQERKDRQTKADEENPRSSQKKEHKSKFRRVNRWFWYTSYFVVGVNLALLYTQDTHSFFNLFAFYPYDSIAKYIYNRYNYYYDFITKPPNDKLLPDQIYIAGLTREPPKTLVLDLTGTIIHQNYEMGKGLLIVKRPGLSQLLKRLSTKYELVIFANEDYSLVNSIADKLDPYHQIIASRLGSESMVIETTGKVKDLRYLNRDLSRVVVVDKSRDVLKHHVQNTIILPLFEGDHDDNKLYEILPLLEHLASPSVTDVRKELQKYGSENPEQKFLEQMKQRKDYLQKQKGGFFGGMGSQFKRN